MTMLERIAEAICGELDYSPGYFAAREAAIAAVKAMREPTDRMKIDAGDIAEGYALAGSNICDIYRAMLDSILSTPPQETGER